MIDKKIKTPYFIIKKEQIDNLINNMVNSLSVNFNNWIIGYSFKTNNLPCVIDYMKKKGLYAEVVSSDEYILAKELGYSVNNIIFNGPIKEKKDFLDALKNKAIVNIDSSKEIEWILECNIEDLRESNIGLRVNFCIEELCPNESQCGIEDGRFGFSYELGELKKVIDLLSNHNINISGLHMHVSSKTRSINIYNAIAETAKKIVNEYNLKLKYLDIGGGFFGGMPEKPNFYEYFSSIKNIISKEPLLNDTIVIVEPGMSLIGASLNYVTTVEDIKRTKNNTFAILDGSRIHIDPLMKKSSYSYEIINLQSSNELNEIILCGFTCMEGDRFFKLFNTRLNCGDKVVFKKVGAYTIGIAPQFIQFHPAIYLDNGDELKLVQNKCTAKDYLKNRFVNTIDYKI